MNNSNIIEPVERSPTIQEATALALNAQLATLLGWTEITTVDGNLVGYPPVQKLFNENLTPLLQRVPNWTNDWADCGPLMVEHGCFPQEKGIHLKDDTIAQIYICVPYTDTCFYVIDYETKNFAVREAIVNGVIQKLSGKGLNDESE